MGPKWLRCALLATIWAGCKHTPEATPPCPEPEPLKLVLKGTDRLNPDEKGGALATVVRIYQLKGSNKIADAGFDELLDNDKTVLADDLVDVKELTLQPAQQLTPPMPRVEGAQYLAVMGLFRQPAGTSWRVLYHLPTADPQHCHRKSAGVVQMVLSENRIELR
ncbi:MAG TPA: type VI secretion system lipoprotein TssJ [Polyangia bacterium]|nr:type VI secretion system lipoprotein TssJ [Polyangia bacterium]